MKRLLFGVLLALASASASSADQNVTTKPNGTVRITASATEVTRLSIAGDRIRRIIKDQTNFSQINDADTGDVFIRYTGPLDKLVTETGYILTERGATVGYELTPATTHGAETVIISVTGMASTGSAASGGSSTASSKAPAFELAAGEGGGGYASSLVAFTRSAIDKFIDGRAAPAKAHGAVIASTSNNGMRAKVVVASGGRAGRYVRPQDFYGPNVLSVWVQRSSLSANERAWVVVVEKR
ncbi:MAG: TraK protein [Verrucomicrobiota bacterium]|jgi:hypothetical protein